jgi:hypothetical protein
LDSDGDKDARGLPALAPWSRAYRGIHKKMIEKGDQGGLPLHVASPSRGERGVTFVIPPSTLWEGFLQGFFFTSFFLSAPPVASGYPSILSPEQIRDDRIQTWPHLFPDSDFPVMPE